MPQKMGNLKVCAKCKEIKPLDEFYVKSSTPDGLDYWCKECSYKGIKIWRELNREHYLKVRKARLQRHYYTGNGKYDHIRSEAKKKGQIVNWKRKDFAAWFDAQEKVCHYCGRKISMGNKKGGRLISLSLDCKEPALGYQPRNVVLSCMRCNIMKGDWLSESQMLDAASRYFNLFEENSDSINMAIRREEQIRLLNHLKGLLKLNPKASLEATIDLIKTTNPDP